MPHGHWKTATLIAGLYRRGVRCATTVDGAVNTDVLVVFTRQMLMPTLARGDVVVMDNLSSHKVAAVREAIEADGAKLLYLPPARFRGPDLNPIEPAFSKIKQRLQSVGHCLVDALWDRMQDVLDTVTPQDAEGFFRHCGYPLQTR